VGHDISSFASAARAPMLLGVKQTSPGAVGMSAYDPKRTCLRVNPMRQLVCAPLVRSSRAFLSIRIAFACGGRQLIWRLIQLSDRHDWSHEDQSMRLHMRRHQFDLVGPK
jgi:hypothetical protein